MKLEKVDYPDKNDPLREHLNKTEVNGGFSVCDAGAYVNFSLLHEDGDWHIWRLDLLEAAREFVLNYSQVNKYNLDIRLNPQELPIHDVINGLRSVADLLEIHAGSPNKTAA